MDTEGICDDYVIADPVRLRQILINLISNAVKYTPENGQILVKVSPWLLTFPFLFLGLYGFCRFSIGSSS